MTLAPTFTKTARADPGDAAQVAALPVTESLRPTPAEGTTVNIAGQAPTPPPPPGHAAAPYAEGAPAYAPPPQGIKGPRVITDWSDGDPVPPGYYPYTRVRTGLVIGGAALFGTAYLESTLSAALLADFSSFPGSTRTSVGALFVPGVGPFIEIGQSVGTTLSLCFALDGLAQLGGMTMFVVGLAVPKTVLVHDEYGSSPRIQFSFAPIVAPGRQGLGLVGTF